MMVYPYFIVNTLISYVVGVILTAGLFLFRES
jgi:capsular polysaccharide biosynthesis protein